MKRLVICLINTAMVSNNDFFLNDMTKHFSHFNNVFSNDTIFINADTCCLYGPCQANLVLIAYASSEGSGELAHPRSLARTSAACSYKQ